MKVTNVNILKYDEKEIKGRAVIFLKSRKADFKIHSMAAQLNELAEDMNLEVEDIIVDSSGSTDVDRAEITELYKCIESSEVMIVLVKSILDITDDIDDLAKFINMVVHEPVVIHDAGNGVSFLPVFSEEADEE